jgi:hypothetical protein
MTHEEAYKLLDDTLLKLGEHFDAVQIAATWSEQSQSMACHRGAGNWYARQGMAHEFIQMDRAQEIGMQVAKQIPQPPTDDSDDWKDR